MKVSTPQLKNYKWKGLTNTGKKASGQVLAISETEVRDRLAQQHIKVKKIKRKGISFFTRLTNRVKGKDITVFTRQLATMLATGVPIIQALKLIGDSHAKAEMKSILVTISKAVESGTPLSKAMRTSSPIFDSLYTDLIASGEQSGNLDMVFERLATYREKSEQLRAKVLKALIYPCMVILVACGVSYLMLTKVIPQFDKMFRGFGSELPWFTLQVLELSHWMQSYGGFIGLAALSSIISARYFNKRSQAFNLMMAKASLRIPVLGKVLSKASIAKFSRTLATSFSAGIPLLTCLKSTASTSGNQYYQIAIEGVHRDTASGMPMYIAMRNSQVFPELVLQMVMIGEESGRLDDMLNKIATIYEFEVDTTVDNLSKILEPFIIVFLGVVVGGLITAMYLPIFNLMNVIG